MSDWDDDEDWEFNEEEDDWDDDVVAYGKLLYEEFSSIHEMINITERREVNKVWKGNTLSSQKGDYHFTHTHNIGEAHHLLVTGWDEPLSKMKAEARKFEKVNLSESMMKLNIRMNIVGHVPCVPRVLMGLPDSMIEYHRDISKQKTLTLLYNISANCGVSDSDLIKSGTSVLNLVTLIEKLGIRVKLQVMELSGAGNTLAGWSITLKDYKQPLDIKKLCFPIAHPSMLRRISFEWMERNPSTPKDFLYGYGCAVDTNIEKQSPALWKQVCKEKNTYYVGFSDTQAVNFDTYELMKRLGIEFK